MALAPEKLTEQPLLAELGADDFLIGAEQLEATLALRRIAPAVLVAYLQTALATWVGQLIEAAQDSALIQVGVGSGDTLALTRLEHQGATITLAGAGASISFSASAQGNGFSFVVWNETGADWIIPSFAGGTRRYPLGVAHTKLLAGGVASFEVATVNGTRYVRISGDTA